MNLKCRLRGPTGFEAQGVARKRASPTPGLPSRSASAAVGGATPSRPRPGAEAQKPSGSRAMTTLSPVTGLGRQGVRAESQGMTEGGPSRGVRPALLSPTQPPHNPHVTPGLTPLQTWPPPAPQCDPGSCWQLWGARGADGAGGCQVQEMENTGVREGRHPTTPCYTCRGGETIQGTGCAAPCPAGMSRVPGWGSWSSSAPDWLDLG